ALPLHYFSHVPPATALYTPSLHDALPILSRFFAWLEGRAYKMHIRVLLSKYRSYDLCPACEGARLKPESLLWRIGSLEDAAAVVDPARRFRPRNLKVDDAVFARLPGLTIYDVMLLPLDRALAFFERLRGPGKWCQTPFSGGGAAAPYIGGRTRSQAPFSATPLDVGEEKRCQTPF